MSEYLSSLCAVATGPGEWAEPRYDPTSGTVVYREFDSVESVDEHVPVLETLREHDLLEREFADRVLVCPSCDSDVLEPGFVCPACGSANTARIPVFEHTDCGCVRPRDAFETTAPDSCPKCKTVFEALSEDCERMGTMHQCRECTERSDVLDTRLECANCGSYTPEEVRRTRLYRYRIPDDDGWPTRLFAVRNGVRRTFESRRCTVTRHDTLLDGEPYCTDLTARPPTDSSDLLIRVFDAVTEARVVDLQQHARRTETRPVIATTPTETSSAGMEFATEQGIPVIWIDTDSALVATENTGSVYGFRGPSTEPDRFESTDSIRVPSI